MYDLNDAEPDRGSEMIPDGTFAKIARWMCRPEAASLGEVAPEPQVSPGALEELADFLNRISSRAAWKNPPEKQHSGGDDETTTVRVRGGSGSSLDGSAGGRAKAPSGAAVAAAAKGIEKKGGGEE